MAAKGEHAAAAREVPLHAQNLQTRLEADVTMRLRAQLAGEVLVRIRKRVAVEKAPPEKGHVELSARVAELGANHGLVFRKLEQEVYAHNLHSRESGDERQHGTWRALFR